MTTLPAWLLIVGGGVCFALGAIFTFVMLWVVQGGLAGGSD